MGGRGASGGFGNAKMPELQGSPKQISWATDIRNKAINVSEINIRNAKRGEALNIPIDYMNPSVKSSKEVKDMLIKAFQTKTSAKEIIDGRGLFTQSALKEMAAEIDRIKGRRK